MLAVQLKMATRNLRAHGKHSLAAVLSLAAGFATLTLFESYFARVETIYLDGFGGRAMYGDVLIEKPGAQDAGLDRARDFSLSEAEQAKLDDVLRSTPGFAERARFLDIVGNAQAGSNSNIVLGFGYDVVPGRELRGEAWRWNANAGVPLDVDGGQKLVLGKAIARTLGCRFDAATTSFTAMGHYPPERRGLECGRVTLSAVSDAGQLNALILDVAGVSDACFAELDSRFAAMPLETAQALLATHRISRAAVKLVPGTDVARFLRDFGERASAAGLVVTATPWTKHVYGDMYRRTMDYLGLFRAFVMTVIIVIVALSVLNTFLKVVVERTPEIGTLRTLGYLPSFIVGLFALEGGLLAALGAGAGTVATLLATLVINLSRIPYKAGLFSEPVPFVVAFRPGIYLLVAIFLGAIAATTAAVSAWQRARMHLPDALTSL